MKARIIVLLLLLICSCAISNDNKTNVINIFYLNIQNNIKIVKTDKYIFSDKEKNIMVRLDYELIINNKNISMDIFLRPKNNKIDDNIIKKENLKSVVANTNFGYGDEYEIINQYGTNIKNKNDIKMLKLISSWSGVADDILAYKFDLNNSNFDSCLINFKNIWSIDNEDIPEAFNVKYIDELILNKNKKVELYKIIDDFIMNIKYFK